MRAGSPGSRPRRGDAMSRYSDEEKAEIIARARAALEEPDDMPSHQAVAEEAAPAPRLTQSFCDMPLLSSEPMRRWKREAEEAEARRAEYREQTTAEVNAKRTRDWERWCDARIARAIECERTDILKAAGQAVGMIREQLRDEIQEAVGGLRAELNVLRAAEKADVITLPALPLRRRSSDAA